MVTDGRWALSIHRSRLRPGLRRIRRRTILPNRRRIRDLRILCALALELCQQQSGKAKKND